MYIRANRPSACFNNHTKVRETILAAEVAKLKLVLKKDIHGVLVKEEFLEKTWAHKERLLL